MFCDIKRGEITFTGFSDEVLNDDILAYIHMNCSKHLHAGAQ